MTVCEVPSELVFALGLCFTSSRSLACGLGLSTIAKKVADGAVFVFEYNQEPAEAMENTASMGTFAFSTIGDDIFGGWPRTTAEGRHENTKKC